MIRLSIGPSGASLQRAEALADVHVHHHALVADGAEEGRPVLPVVVARQAHQVGQLGHRHGPAALARQAPDLLGHALGVPHREDAQRDEASGVGRAPLVHVPVVVGLEHHVGEVVVRGFVEETGVEAGEGREAHGGQDPVAVHVANPLVDVVGAGPHLGQAGRLEPPLLLRPGDHGVEARREGRHPLEGPRLHTLLVGDQLGSLVLQVGRHVLLEHVGGLDDVVVDAHENQVFGSHGGSSGEGRWPRDGIPA